MPLVSGEALRLVAEVWKATVEPAPERKGKKLPGSPGRPRGPTDTRRVVPRRRSRTNTSFIPLVSRRTRFVAAEVKATYRPFAEIVGSTLPLSPCRPFAPTETRCTRPDRRSRTKTSSAPLVSPGTRLDASDTKATKRPSADIAGTVCCSPLPPLACSPVPLTDTRTTPDRVRRSAAVGAGAAAWGAAVAAAGAADSTGALGGPAAAGSPASRAVAVD